MFDTTFDGNDKQDHKDASLAPGPCPELPERGCTDDGWAVGERACRPSCQGHNVGFQCAPPRGPLASSKITSTELVSLRGTFWALPIRLWLCVSFEISSSTMPLTPETGRDIAPTI